MFVTPLKLLSSFDIARIKGCVHYIFDTPRKIINCLISLIINSFKVSNKSSEVFKVIKTSSFTGFSSKTALQMALKRWRQPSGLPDKILDFFLTKKPESDRKFFKNAKSSTDKSD